MMMYHSSETCILCKPLKNIVINLFIITFNLFVNFAVKVTLQVSFNMDAGHIWGTYIALLMLVGMTVTPYNRRGLIPLTSNLIHWFTSIYIVDDIHRSAGQRVNVKVIVDCLLLLDYSPVRTRGYKSGIRPPYPSVSLKATKWGGVSGSLYKKGYPRVGIGRAR